MAPIMLLLGQKSAVSQKAVAFWFITHNGGHAHTHPLVCHSDSQQTVGHRTPAAGSPVVRICLSERGVCGL